MINETNVNCFLCLAETLNFTEASKVLYMTQQAVSKHIAKLENDLGFSLFVRTRHFVSLTKAGESFYKMFSEFKNTYNKTVEENRNYYSQLSKDLHVGYLEWLDLARYVQKSISMLESEVPDIKYYGERYTRGELNNNLLNRKVQLIITYGSFAPRISGLRRAILLETPNILLVSANNPLATNDAGFSTFIHEPLIITSFRNESTSEINKRISGYIRKFGLSPSEVKVVPNRETAYTSTELGQGVMISTDLSRISTSNDIKKYPIGYTETLVCLWHNDEENPLVEKYVNCLKHAAQIILKKQENKIFPYHLD